MTSSQLTPSPLPLRKDLSLRDLYITYHGRDYCLDISEFLDYLETRLGRRLAKECKYNPDVSKWRPFVEREEFDPYISPHTPARVLGWVTAKMLADAFSQVITWKGSVHRLFFAAWQHGIIGIEKMEELGVNVVEGDACLLPMNDLLPSPQAIQHMRRKVVAQGDLKKLLMFDLMRHGGLVITTGDAGPLCSSDVVSRNGHAMLIIGKGTSWHCEIPIHPTLMETINQVAQEAGKKLDDEQPWIFIESITLELLGILVSEVSHGLYSPFQIISSWRLGEEERFISAQKVNRGTAASENGRTPTTIGQTLRPNR